MVQERRSAIPHPEFTSWMHERCELPRETPDAMLRRWKSQPVILQALDAVASWLFIKTGSLSGRRRHVTYKVFMHVIRLYFRLFNRLKVFGKKNIPKHGCIFYVNHPGSFDPPILWAALPDLQVGAFVVATWGWFADAIEKVYGITRLHLPAQEQKVEFMVRQILARNAFFAIWPEGHPHEGPIEQGFSGIARVYAVLNYNKNRIPFVPVLIRGKAANRQMIQHKMGQIEIHFFKPRFLDRQWLQRPEEGGKTPREIIDYLMDFLARKNGQATFAPNPFLEKMQAWHAKIASQNQ
jgi:1-acyl-sn-glycerol-3-phosphate acyltransferase